MELNCETLFKVFVYVVAALVALKIIQDNCDIGLAPLFEGFTGSEGVMASEGVSRDAGPMSVQGLSRTPSTCYPQPTLKAEDLLPKEDSAAIQEFNQVSPKGEGILEGVRLLDAGFHVGVNTVGQSLRNANRQLRSEPPNPQVNVSPWLNTSIGPDLLRRPLEDGEGCAAAPSDGPPGASPGVPAPA